MDVHVAYTKAERLVLGVSRKRLAALIVLFLLSIAFLVLAIVFFSIVDLIIDKEISQKLPLENGTFAYKFWQKPPVPVSFNIYVFDITNPDEVLDGTEVPAVIEKGPYVYRMNIKKTNIKWHKNNTVEYIQPQMFHFDREASVGPDTDTFLTINIPYITVANMLQYEYPWLQKTVDAYFRSKDEDTFMNRSVSDIWWGYEDPVLHEVAKVLHKFNITSPFLNGKFGFYMDRNNTGDGLYNVYSGSNKKFDNYVEIDRWNGLINQSLWTTDYANGIRGTDGSMHPPYVTKQSNLSIFDAYLRRSLKLKYNSTSSFKGIRTLRFYVPYSEFATASENPDNAGYCTPSVENCIPSGAYNYSVASYYAPMYVSLPHFVGGDPYYLRQVKGLKPSQSKHQPFYDIQALTGVSLRAARRYQIIVRGQSYEYFLKFKTFPESYIPIIWIDGMAELDDDTANMFITMLQNPLDAMPYVRGALFGLFGLLLLISIVLFVYWRRKHGKRLYQYKVIDNANGERDPLRKKKKKSKHGRSNVPHHATNARPDDVIAANGHATVIERNTASGDTGFERSATNRGLETIYSEPVYDNNFGESQYFDTRPPTSPDNLENYQSFSST